MLQCEKQMLKITVIWKLFKKQLNQNFKLIIDDLKVFLILKTPFKCQL